MVLRCPKWFRNWVLGGPSLETAEDLNDLLEIIQEHSKDIGMLNTGLQRVERKQNRWILKGEDNGDGGKLPSPEGVSIGGPGATVAPVPGCGEPTEETNPFY